MLDDAMSEEIVHKIDYDSGKFHLAASPVINIAHRARKLDEVACFFLTRTSIDGDTWRLMTATAPATGCASGKSARASRRQTGSPRRAGLRGPSTTRLQVPAFRRLSSFASPLAPILLYGQLEADDHAFRTFLDRLHERYSSLQLAGM